MWTGGQPPRSQVARAARVRARAAQVRPEDPPGHWQGRPPSLCADPRLTLSTYQHPSPGC